MEPLDRVQEALQRAMYALDMPSRFESPDEVREFFKESLIEMARVTVMDVAEGEGWEESEQHYLSRIEAINE